MGFMEPSPKDLSNLVVRVEKWEREHLLVGDSRVRRHVLVALYAYTHEAPCRVKDLVRLLQRPERSIRVCLMSLEKQGLIRSARDLEDPRGRVYCLPERMRSRLAQYFAFQIELWRGLNSQVGHDRRSA